MGKCCSIVPQGEGVCSKSGYGVERGAERVVSGGGGESGFGVERGAERAVSGGGGESGLEAARDVVVNLGESGEGESESDVRVGDGTSQSGRKGSAICNHFVVKYDGVEIKSNNMVLNRLYSDIAANRPYSAYIAVGDGYTPLPNSLNKLKLIRAAVIDDYHYDVVTGSPYVTRSITLGEDEFVGLAIREMGFCADTSGKVANYASFAEPIIKEQGKELVISGTLMLNIAIDGMNFVGGDNPLIKNLLGVEALSSQITAFRCKDNYLVSNFRAVYKEMKDIPAADICMSVEYTRSMINLKFKLLWERGETYEIYVCAGGVPIIRSNFFNEDLTHLAHAETAATPDCVEIKADNILDIKSIAYLSRNQYNADGILVRDEWTDVDLRFFPIKFPANCKMTTDLKNRYLMVTSDDYVAVWELVNEELKLKRKIRAAASQLECILSDGSVIIYEKERSMVVCHICKQNVYTVTEFACAGGQKMYACYGNNQNINIMMIKSGSMELFEVRTDTKICSSLEKINLSDKPIIFVVNFYSYMVWRYMDGSAVDVRQGANKFAQHYAKWQSFVPLDPYIGSGDVAIVEQNGVKVLHMVLMGQNFDCGLSNNAGARFFCSTWYVFEVQGNRLKIFFADRLKGTVSMFCEKTFGKAIRSVVQLYSQLFVMFVDGSHAVLKGKAKKMLVHGDGITINTLVVITARQRVNYTAVGSAYSVLDVNL